MDVHGSGEEAGIVTPDFFEKFLASESLAAILDEVAQQLEFPRREDDGLAILQNFRFGEVESYRAKVKGFRSGFGPGQGAPQKGFDTGEELGHFEGLPM